MAATYSNVGRAASQQQKTRSRSSPSGVGIWLAILGVKGSVNLELTQERQKELIRFTQKLVNLSGVFAVPYGQSGADR